MAQSVLIWTCVLVFIATSVITILGIVNKLKIDKAYLNELFLALILEVIAIGVLAFKDGVEKVDTNFVKIIMPARIMYFIQLRQPRQTCLLMALIASPMKTVCME